MSIPSLCRTARNMHGAHPRDSILYAITERASPVKQKEPEQTLKKVRASNLTGDPRVQFPRVSEETGLIYSISDADSPVKRKEPEQTPQNKVRGSKNLYAVAGVRFPGKSLQGGLTHSISDAGSPVKRKASKQPASARQK